MASLIFTGINREAMALIMGQSQPLETECGPPKTDIEFSFKRAGRAGWTKTQELLRKDSPKERPEWYWDLVAGRPSWRNATDHKARFHSVSLVTDPLPELEFGKGIPDPRFVSVGFSTAKVSQ